jgi:hypothetical protein
MEKNSIKILVPTPVFPEKKSIRINFINQILMELNKTVNVELIWLVFLPDKFNSYYFKEHKVSSIHDFCDGIDILKKIQPDCVLVGSHFEPIQYSLSLAARKLKIPLCSFFYSEYKTDNTDNHGKINQLSKYLKIISSNSMPSDTGNESKFLRRFKFIFYKFSFLKNTQKTLKIHQSPSFIFFPKSLINYLFWKKIPINTLSDLFLLPNSSWVNPLLEIGIKKEKLSITGNPLWDNFTLNPKSIKNRNTSSKISILIVTDPLVQHGIWSTSKYISFLNTVISNLIKENKFSFSLKIHPASENKQFYLKLINKFKKYITIYQNQSIYEIIDNYDLVLSFGFSTIHSEIVLSETRMILLDFNFNFPFLDFVQESVDIGNTKICKNINSLNNLIHSFVTHDISNIKFLEQMKSKYSLTEKSGVLCADAIKNLVNNYNN